LTALLGFANTLNRRKEAKEMSGILLGSRTWFHKLDYGTMGLRAGPKSRSNSP